MRKVKVYTTSGMPGTIETNVTTLGELKPLLRQREINIDGMKLLVGETKNELALDEALLPETDFKLFLMPAKTKSGVDFDEMEEAQERIEDKVDEILRILKNGNAEVYANADKVSQPKNQLSYEEQRDMEELQRLSGTSKNEWGS